MVLSAPDFVDWSDLSGSRLNGPRVLDLTADYSMSYGSGNRLWGCIPIPA